MKKNLSLIIGTGILGAYLATLLLQKNHKVVVTSRHLKKNYYNYKKLNIQNKITFKKLNILNKKEIFKIISKFKPKNIFYFAGQSSLTKSKKLKNETNNSNFVGAKNFLITIKNNNFKSNFFKANSGHIFKPKKGIITIDSKFSKNKNPYIESQIKAFKIVKLYRNKGVKAYNLVFLQVESPLRQKEFFIKKVCIHAKNKSKITVGNILSIRDYSWVNEIIKAIYYTTKIQPLDIIISSGVGISCEKVLSYAYKQNNLDYKKFFYINSKFIRKSEEKTLKGSIKNYKILNKKFGFKFRIHGLKLVKKMFESI